MIEETLERAPKTLGTMLDYLGLDASVKSEERNGNVSLTVFSEDAGRIIGRKGLALQSLQLLLNRIIAKGNRDCPRIFIDVDGYKKPERRPRRDDKRNDAPRDDRRDDRREDRGGERRRESAPDNEEQLTKKAIDAAKEVKRWGESVTIPPMNAHDRRIIHLTLDEDSEISTESVSQGNDERLKSIIVSLKQ
jgi:spoIIIJ-associated protein